MFSLANITMPSMPILSNMPSISILSNMPSISIPSVLFTALAMLMGTLLHELLVVYKKLIPRRLLDKILSQLKSLIQSYRSRMTLVIHEHINGLSINEMFEASEIYLRPKISPSVERLEISKVPREKDICINISPGQQIMDTFEGIQLTWVLICTPSEKKRIDDKGRISYETVERRAIELKFHKKYREKVLSSYLSYVLERSKAMKEESKVMKLHSYGGEWRSVNLDYPSTFNTLAMDPTLKRELMDDLDKFVKRREFYRNVGRAWKRGYLLYGPPGMGKSSLIAAMANYLKFHIYVLELTRLTSNSELQNLIVSTANQSILVIEDIDCCKISQNRQDEGQKTVKKRLTLSGLLNFVDGLWSCCGDEKIIIFTTNHKDKLDPALLRPGRMDMHILMSYCTPCGFKILASNYLGGIQNHSMFTEIEKLVTEVEVTSAEIAAELMKSDEADIALGGLIKFLHMKKTEHDKAIAEGEKEDSEQAKESPGNIEGAENESEEK